MKTRDLKRAVTDLAKNRVLYGTVIDVVGHRCSVQLGGNGRVLRGIPYSGGPASAGDSAIVSYETGRPVAHLTGRTLASSTPSTKPIRSRAVVTDLSQSQLGGGLGQTEGQFLVIGTDDEVQFIVKAHSTQTNNIVEIQDNNGNSLVQVDGSGNITIGAGAAGVDYTITIDGETNDLVITWMEDEARLDIDSLVNMAAGLRTVVSTDDVSDPPTDAELDSAFGTPASLGEGFVGVVDDNSGDTDVWLCWTSDGSWYYSKGTKAV